MIRDLINRMTDKIIDQLMDDEDGYIYTPDWKRELIKEERKRDKVRKRENRRRRHHL